jgi:beta-lysine 5,6-aminomutase alpha subunit
MADVVAQVTGQGIQLLGMMTEAIHNPLLMDRYLSLKATKYVFSAAKSLGDEISIKPDGIMARRAVAVLEEACSLLEEVDRDTIWEAIARGAFADVKRSRTGGKGYAGVTERAKDYINPILDELEKA